jgi:hypothetical protein
MMAFRFFGLGFQNVIGIITISPTTFTAGTPNGVIGAISVPMLTPTEAFTGTLVIGGTNSGGFQLSSATLPSNLLQSTGGTAADTYTDFTITPTQANAINSGVAQSGFSITGS